ncbi:hypothetical protein BKA70DRAFT_1406155 [Coprinopsis sp. MPI-PUGE-AT-0042]|nr:hypothetical protein BKA70DRAFT_1406155 [Coprinopsis sp. MPI-PUGE-AT-0042]
MKPGIIAVAGDKEDIKIAVRWARDNKKAIAIRTGGHQYSGASSTGPGNMLLDVSTTFRNPEDRCHWEEGPKSFVRTSVSYNLGEFNDYLGSLNCFVPHGQCEFVHLGGHVQTGGYGQLGRSFGLLGDHVVSLEIIDHAGEEQEIKKDQHPDLFFAWLGGSPGNMGILTHFTIEVHRDKDYMGSMGLRAVHFYSKAKITELVGYLAEMNDNPDFPRNYDLCISVLSGGAQIHSYMKGLEAELEKMLEHPPPEAEVPPETDMPSTPGSSTPFRMIVVYAQWVPFSKDDKPDMGWFKQFSNPFFHAVEKPMSKLTAEWIFHSRREFNHPYVKRTYVTKSTNLSTNGWIGWVVDRMNSLMHWNNGQWLSAQLQCFGGKNSQLTRNAGNGTAYSWRDLSMCMTIDNFHESGKKAKAKAEHGKTTTTKGAIGPDGLFSKQDMRVLGEAYERIRKARTAADPEGILTPNALP